MTQKTLSNIQAIFLKSGWAEGPLSNKRTEESHVECDVIVEQANAGWNLVGIGPIFAGWDVSVDSFNAFQTVSSFRILWEAC